MTRGVLGVLAFAMLAPVYLSAQTVRFKLDAIGMTYQEAREGRDGIGAGVGGGIEWRFKRFRFDVRAFGVNVDPDSAGIPDFDLAQVDVRIGYLLTPFLALELGGGHRYVQPDFATQEVGVFRVGVSSENVLTRLASVWVRGAYLVNPQFSGGGSAELAFEFGLGVGVGTANGRFRFHAEYEFQRIDRTVNAVDVPIQTSLARTGIALGF